MVPVAMEMHHLDPCPCDARDLLDPGAPALNNRRPAETQHIAPEPQRLLNVGYGKADMIDPGDHPHSSPLSQIVR